VELVGNALCLDFANTVNSRLRPVRDSLDSESSYVDWLRRVGLDGSTPSLVEARRLREVIYATFSAIAAGRTPRATDLARIAEAYGHAVTHATLVPVDGHYDLTWPAPDPLWSVAASAGTLLLNGPLNRVGECPGCGWLFLDTSRNGTRRWCSMATCGSRDKMARYHARPPR